MTLADLISVDPATPGADIRMCADAVAPGAAALVAEVLAGGRVAAGPKVELFEEACAAMAGTEHAVAVTNGTVALELLLDALGIGPGDEVIVPAFTFAASAAAVLRVGATARLVDVGTDGTIDADAVEAAIGPHTAAIMPVHLYGLPAAAPRLAAACARYGLALVEDAAQAHGAAIWGKPVGGWGHGSFSFYATKNVSCGEGGAITTDDADLADRLRLRRNQGMRERHLHIEVGTNHRMSELHAALGLASMARLARNSARRRHHAARLTAGLADLGLGLPDEPMGWRHAWHQYTVTHIDRDTLSERLAARGVETGVHYPRPLHHQPAFAGHRRVRADQCPQSTRLAATCLSLPVHHDLDDADTDRIVVEVRRALGAA